MGLIDAIARIMRILPAALLLLATLPARAAPPVVVHVTVALCDNASQGIVPVPAAIGDGNDPKTNLYWGATFGLKSWLRRDGWAIQKAESPQPAVLERIIARKRVHGRQIEITADAWRGNRIREAITSFIEAAGGDGPGRNADVVVYIGHDGLMEFAVSPQIRGANPNKPKSIVLACASLQYFSDHLHKAGSQPILLTTGLMAPEAYTLTAALEAWTSGSDVREAAAQAYHRHQSCSIKAARQLFR
jgi:hypothetical protein